MSRSAIESNACSPLCSSAGVCMRLVNARAHLVSVVHPARLVRLVFLSPACPTGCATWDNVTSGMGSQRSRSRPIPHSIQTIRALSTNPNPRMYRHNAQHAPTHGAHKHLVCKQDGHRDTSFPFGACVYPRIPVPFLLDNTAHRAPRRLHRLTQSNLRVHPDFLKKSC